MKNTLLMLAAAVLLCGCGYHFAGTGVLPGNVRTIGVAIFENRTAETGVEHFFTNDLIYEMTRNGMNVSGTAGADAVFTGIIESLNIDTVSRKGLITSLERRIRATVSVRLENKNGDLLWSGNGITDEETYGVLSEKAATEYGKRAAIQTLSRRIAEDIYSRLTFAAL